MVLCERGLATFHNRGYEFIHVRCMTVKGSRAVCKQNNVKKSDKSQYNIADIFKIFKLKFVKTSYYEIQSNCLMS